MDVIEQLMQHRSIRQFKGERLSDDIIMKLVKAGQAASTSSYLQAYSIIGITDPAIKHELRKVSGQPYVEHNGHLFVFIADLYRHSRLAEQADKPIDDYLGTTESLLVAAIDASLAAQNMAAAAESIGLGICYIGSLRNDMQRVIELLELPQHTIPLFGMVVGVPDQQGSMKERLPAEHIYHENHYQHDPAYFKQVADYDERIAQYYRERTNGERADRWSEQIIAMLNEKTREDVDGVVKNQGFLKQ